MPHYLKREFILALSSTTNEKFPDNEGLKTRVFISVFTYYTKSILYCPLHCNLNYFVKIDWSASQKTSYNKATWKKDEDKD